MVAHFLTVTRTATTCTTSTASSVSFARQASPWPNPPTFPGAVAISARSTCPVPFVLLSPGSSPHRLLKRWPADRYRELAAAMAARGMAPVVVGTEPERAMAGEILEGIPDGIDLTGRTDFAQITSLARAASLAVGNDTGPMHVIAAAGCPSVVLFSNDSDPALCAPRGPHVSVLRRPISANSMSRQCSMR